MTFTSLAERVDLLVKLSGLDRKGLSIAAGLAQAHVGMIVRGEISSPERGTIEKLARTTSSDPAWLFFGTGNPPTQEQVQSSPAITMARTSREQSDSPASSDDATPDAAE